MVNAVFEAAESPTWRAAACLRQSLICRRSALDR